MDLSDVCQISWIHLIRVSVIRINVNWIGVIPIYRFFAPTILSFKAIFVLSFFENIVTSEVFH